MGDGVRVPICVFAKPPRPGSAKTRLIPADPAGAARLARAFLRDTWSSVCAIPWAEPILATTDLAIAESGLAADEIWLQGDGDLGARLERVLGRALERSRCAIAIGADTPGLPRARLESARARLADHDAVLGPCDDGGFYLIGLTREALRRDPALSAVPPLLGGLPWSAADTCARTEQQLRERGLAVARLPSWFDVDLPADLERLGALLSSGEIAAPETAAELARRAMGLGRCAST